CAVAALGADDLIWAGGSYASFDKSAAGTAIPDYNSSTNAWGSAGNTLFGACLHAVSNATGIWTQNACGFTERAGQWIPTQATFNPASKVVQKTTVGGANASVGLRFGARVATTATPGTYRASMIAEILAPNV